MTDCLSSQEPLESGNSVAPQIAAVAKALQTSEEDLQTHLEPSSGEQANQQDEPNLAEALQGTTSDEATDALVPTPLLYVPHLCVWNELEMNGSRWSWCKRAALRL